MNKKKIRFTKLKSILCLVLFISLCTGCSTNKELSELALNIEGTKFTINGTLEKVSKDDWSMNTYEEDTIEPGTERNILLSSTKNEDIQVMIILKNNSEENKMVKEASIYNIAIYDIEKYLPNLKMANGITAKSTYKDVIKKYGQPMSQHANYYQDVLSYTTTYYSNNMYVNAEQMTFEFKDEKLYRIWLQAPDEIEEGHKINFDLKEVIGFNPLTKASNLSIDYSDTLLNTHVLVGDIKIEKETTLNKLLEDGWKVTSSFNYIDVCDLILTKGSESLEVSCNGQYKMGETLDKNMKITEVDMDLAREDDIVYGLPAELSISDDLDTIIKKIGAPQSIVYSDRGVRISYIKSDEEGNMLNATYIEFDSTNKMTDFSIKF